MLASVIICTYNRSKYLNRLLNSLAGQTIPANRFEIIVVDDGSDDETQSVCRRYRCRFPNMVCLFLKDNLGIACARNAGITASKSDLLLFTDDDCIPAENWVEKSCEALNMHPIVAGAVDGPTSPYPRLCHNIAEFHAFMMGRKPGLTPFIAGANMAIQRKVLSALNGFNESLRIAEDMDLILRARIQGYGIYFFPESLVMHHHDRKRLSQIVGYSIQHAMSTIHLRNRYGEFMKTPFVLRSPLFLILGAPLIAMVATCAIFLRNPLMARFIHAAPVVFGLKLAWCWGAAKGLNGRRQVQIL